MADNSCCSGCHMMLKEPFVQCQECFDVLICTSCFSKGREFAKHKSNHEFSVVKNTFSLFESTWNASEELHLLNGVLKFGYGNWDDIARTVPAKDALECHQHFQKIYVEDASGEFKSTLTGQPDGKRRDEPLTYQPEVGAAKKASVNSGIYYGSGLMRPGPGTQTHKELAGFNAARSDFESEFENQFETNLSQIETNELMYQVASGPLDKRPTFASDGDEEDYLDAALSVSMLDVYRSKMKARQRRKRMIKEYGLLNKPKAMCLPSRYPHLNAAGPKYESLYKLGSKLMCSMDFDFTLEGLHHEMMLRQQILHLQQYRQSGVKKFAGINVFHKMKVSRDHQLRQLSTMNENIRDWIVAEKLNKNYVSFYEDKDHNDWLIPTTLGSTRRSAAPLNIVGLPAYDKLTADERELCSEQRVLPEVFLEIKTMMLEECMKQNGLRLANVRPLVKIDVNKTRKLYDYFLKNELIYKPQEG